MNFFYLYVIVILGILKNTPTAFSKEDSTTLGYNPNSLNPIPESEIMFRKRIWREVYLKEKRNKPFFVRGKEITKVIIEGVKKGLLTPYEDVDFTTVMSNEKFIEKLKLPDEEDSAAKREEVGFTVDTDWEDSGQGKDPSHQEEDNTFLPNEISTLEIMEDIIFDKIRSRLRYDIQYVKLIIPANKFATGIRREVAIFKYKELATYFDSIPKEASWVNVKNNIENLTWTEAFELRQFGSRIVKIENPDDATLDELYNKTPQSGIIASQKLGEELLEMEYFLWEP